MEELKQIDEEVKKEIIKHKKDVLSYIVVEMKRKQDEGLLIDFDEMMEIINSLSETYGN